MNLHGITQIVTSLERSRQFYEEVLGFTPGESTPEMRWQSYEFTGTMYFAVGEAPGSTIEIAFAVDDLDALWQRIKDRVRVVTPPETTSWGAYRFVIHDPDGYVLAFVQAR